MDNDIPAQILTFTLTNSPAGDGHYDQRRVQLGAVWAIGHDHEFHHRGRHGQWQSPAQHSSDLPVVIAADLNANLPVIAPGGISLSWNAITGLTYRVQYKNNLTDTGWTDLPGDISGDQCRGGETGFRPDECHAVLTWHHRPAMRTGTMPFLNWYALAVAAGWLFGLVLPEAQRAFNISVTPTNGPGVAISWKVQSTTPVGDLQLLPQYEVIRN